MWWKIQKSQWQSVSPSPFSLHGLYLFACKCWPCHSEEQSESCLPEWGRRQHSSGPGDEGGVWSAKGEKCQHLSVTAWQMANYHFFFPASLSRHQTKPLSSRLCCLRHFPPLLHLWYANSKTEWFCEAEKDLWAHSLGQQSQLLCWGSACCARTRCQGTSLPPAPPLTKQNQNSGINHLAFLVPGNLPEQIMTWNGPFKYFLDWRVTSWTMLSTANCCLSRCSLGAERGLLCFRALQSS